MVKRILRITGFKRILDGKTDLTDCRIGTDLLQKVRFFHQLVFSVKTKKIRSNPAIRQTRFTIQNPFKPCNPQNPFYHCAATQNSG